MIHEVQFDPVKHEFRRDGILFPSVTQILRAAGKCNFDFVEQDVLIHAQNRGQSVHWMCQLEDQGALNPRKVPRSLRGYRKAWKAFKANCGFIPDPEWTERKFASGYWYAGIIDRAGILGNTFAVVDLKTGSITDAARLQLTAYTLAIEPRPALASWIRRVAVRLNRNGTYNIREWDWRSYHQDLAEFFRMRDEWTPPPRNTN